MQSESEIEMAVFAYPATVEEYEPGDFKVRFADVPEATTFGHTPEEALGNAPDALSGAIEHYLEREPSMPGPPRRQAWRIRHPPGPGGRRAGRSQTRHGRTGHQQRGAGQTH